MKVAARARMRQVRQSFCLISSAFQSSGNHDMTMTRREFLSASAALAVAPAFAGIAIVQVPEPATMTLFGLGAGGVYLAKRFIGRK